MINLLIFTLLFATQNVAANNYHYFEAGTARIAYREFGTGTPIIILNGGPGRSSDPYVPFAKELSQLGFQAIIFDQRGTGKSKVDWTVEMITFDLMIQDLENLRKHLKLQTLSILGHSFGGMYAMAYAAQYPNRVKHLLLLASTGIDLSWEKYLGANFRSRISTTARKKLEQLETQEAQQIKDKKDISKVNYEIFRLLAPAFTYNPKIIPQVANTLANPAFSKPPVYNLVWKSVKNFDLKGQFKNFKAPALILSGRQDFLGEQVPLTIHQEIPHSELHFLNECGHYPWLDQPKETFALIKKFLTAHAFSTSNHEH